MHDLLAALRAAAEPTRLRLLALAARGAFCVVEFTEILGQSQPRLSRHLRLLCDAGLLDRSREGANVWFALSGGSGGGLARELLARLPAGEPVLEADRRHAARVLAERARGASDSFRRSGADWDEMRALGLPAEAVERALLSLLPPGAMEVGLGRVLDVGTGTGRLLELLGPRAESALGVDASRAMLALARARLAGLDLPGCAVRLGDMYRLGLPAGGFDLAVLQMVLHHAEDPAAALAEAARCLRPGGRLLVVELAAHGAHGRAQGLAHRWPGFTDDGMAVMLRAAGLLPLPPVAVPGGALPDGALLGGDVPATRADAAPAGTASRAGGLPGGAGPSLVGAAAGAAPGVAPDGVASEVGPDGASAPAPATPGVAPGREGLCVRIWAADAPPGHMAGVLRDAASGLDPALAAADRPSPSAPPVMRTRA